MIERLAMSDFEADATRRGSISRMNAWRASDHLEEITCGTLDRQGLDASNGCKF
jgi:hypothetical protein